LARIVHLSTVWVRSSCHRGGTTMRCAMFCRAWDVREWWESARTQRSILLPTESK
jgi:hypothetical protein